MTTSGSIPLLGNPPPFGGDAEVSPPSCWSRFKERLWTVGTGFSLAAIAGSAAAVFSKIPWVSSLGALGLGLATTRLTHGLTATPDRPLLRRIITATLGQSLLFFLTQLYENTTQSKVMEFADQTIIGLFGANLAVYALIKQERLGVRIESDPDGYTSGPVFKEIFTPLACKDGFRLCAALFLGLTAKSLEDPVYQGIGAFFTAFYALQILGGRLAQALDERISFLSRQQQGRTGFRSVKLLLTSIAPFGISAILLPFGGGSIVSFSVQGGCVGFFDGLSSQAIENRLQNIPIENLTELEQHREPSHHFGKVALRVWRASLPVIDLIGLMAFVLWQAGWDLDDPDQKDAVGALLASFAGTFTLALLADASWNHTVRSQISDPSRLQKISDKLIIFFHLLPNVLGIHPAYFFSVVTRSLSIDDRAMQKGEGDKKKALFIASWIAYGAGWAIERFQTWSDRKGLDPKMILMFFTNAALTFKRRFNGEIA